MKLFNRLVQWVFILVAMTLFLYLLHRHTAAVLFSMGLVIIGWYSMPADGNKKQAEDRYPTVPRGEFSKIIDGKIYSTRNCEYLFTVPVDNNTPTGASEDLYRMVKSDDLDTVVYIGVLRYGCHQLMQIRDEAFVRDAIQYRMPAEQAAETNLKIFGEQIPYA